MYNQKKKGWKGNIRFAFVTNLPAKKNSTVSKTAIVLTCYYEFEHKIMSNNT